MCFQSVDLGSPLYFAMKLWWNFLKISNIGFSDSSGGRMVVLQNEMYMNSGVSGQQTDSTARSNP